MADTKRKAMFVDGHSLLHRAFYALPTLTSSQGEYTNAILGFTMMLMRLLEDEKPDFLAVAFDEAAPTFRHQQYQEYKGHRKPMPEELRPQVQGVREVVAAFNIPTISLAGYEADDVLGTAAKLAAKADYLAYIVTGDRDCLQLVDEGVRALITRRGIKDLELFDTQKVIDTYGVTPDQFADLKGLMGDKSDNIPGVPGIGEKTAAKLLQQYGSIATLYENLDGLKGKQKENLATHKEQAELSLQLATIDCCVPIEINFDTYQPENWNAAALQQLFARFEFRQLLDKLAAKFPEVGARKQETAPGTAELSNQEQLFAGSEPTDWTVDVIDQLAQLDPILAQAAEDKTLMVDLYLDGSDAISGQVAAIALAVPGKAALVPLGECQGVQDEPAVALDSVLGLLAEILANKTVLKIGYDLKPLVVCCLKEGIPAPDGVFDTALAGYLCNPSQPPARLEDLVMQHFDTYVPPLAELTGAGAKAKKFSEVDQRELAGFAARRLQYLHRLQHKLAEKMATDELEQLFSQMETPLITVLAEMELTGIAVDTNELRLISAELEQRIEQLTQDIYQMAGGEFNINSPKQLGVLLFDQLGLPVLKKTKTGPSTSAEVLEQLAEENEIVERILDYRQLVKLKSTYVDALDSLVNPISGRIHTSFNQMVTATGRLSSTNPNLQNIPVRTEEGRRIRSAFVPGEPGYVILAADYSQIELRVLAHMSGDENLIDAFVNDQDIHTRTAAEVFGLPIEAVTSKERGAAKAINFGIVYGISSFGLAKGTGLSRQDAQRYIDSYFERYPGVKQYLDWSVEEARSKGYVTTLLNRRRYLPDIKSRKWPVRSFAERTAMNTPIQGSAADIIKKAMLAVKQELLRSQLQTRLLLQVHDELVLEVAKEQLRDTAALIKEAMESVIALSVPLKVDVKSGPNWRDTEKLTL